MKIITKQDHDRWKQYWNLRNRRKLFPDWIVPLAFVFLLLGNLFQFYLAWQDRIPSHTYVVAVGTDTKTKRLVVVQEVMNFPVRTIGDIQVAQSAISAFHEVKDPSIIGITEIRNDTTPMPKVIMEKRK
jgi:hypothetical protein